MLKFCILLLKASFLFMKFFQLFLKYFPTSIISLCVYDIRGIFKFNNQYNFDNLFWKEKGGVNSKHADNSCSKYV